MQIHFSPLLWFPCFLVKLPCLCVFLTVQQSLLYNSLVPNPSCQLPSQWSDNLHLSLSFLRFPLPHSPISFPSGQPWVSLFMCADGVALTGCCLSMQRAHMGAEKHTRTYTLCACHLLDSVPLFSCSKLTVGWTDGRMTLADGSLFILPVYDTCTGTMEMAHRAHVCVQNIFFS